MVAPIIYFGVVMLASCLTAEEIGDPLPADGANNRPGDGGTTDQGHDGKDAIDGTDGRMGMDGGSRDAYLVDTSADMMTPDALPLDMLPPDTIPDTSPPLIAPECAEPLNNTLFIPNEDGTFDPLEWTTTPGANYLLRLWKLSSPDTPPGEAELLFEEEVGEVGSTAEVFSFSSLDYRTDYLWEVSACSVSDPDSCLSSGLCQFTTTHHGLIGWWRFDESAGEEARDSSGNGNNGALIGADGPPIWAEGISGGALLFDGVDDHVLVEDVAVLDGMDTLTVEAWTNTTTREGNRAIVAKWWGDPNSYALRTATLDLGKASFGTQTALGSAPISISTSAINDSSWHHLAGVYDGSFQQVCVEGVCESPMAQSGSIFDSDKELCFGAYCYSVSPDLPTLFFPGLIDEIAIYNRALSPEEILQNCRRHDPTGDLCDD